MKKKIIFLVALLSLTVACSDKKSETTATQEQVVATQNETTENTQKVDKKDIKEVEDFSDFQDKLLQEFSSLDITSVEVNKYAKGIEISFITTNKDFTNDKFIEISKHSLEEFRNEYIIDETIKIPTSLSYQKDSESDSVFLYEYKE